jgi:hypothetical protein
MKRKMIALLVLTAAVASASAMAQGQGKGYRFNQKNTPGWTLMTPEERADFRGKMLASKTYDECKEVQAKHHELMMKRAQDKGVTLNMPKTNACDRMKARGMIK